MVNQKEKERNIPLWCSGSTGGSNPPGLGSTPKWGCHGDWSNGSPLDSKSRRIGSKPVSPAISKFNILEVLRMRGRAWRRYKNYTKAKRKRKIDINSNWWPANYAALFNYEVRTQRIVCYDNLNQYSKNKIHCSCPMCSAKTRNKGKHRKNRPYAPSINYRRMDLRRQQAMDADIESYNED